MIGTGRFEGCVLGVANEYGVDRLGVHNTHCCKEHGCKYGDFDCPVEHGPLPGVRCESCDWDEEQHRECHEEIRRLKERIEFLQNQVATLTKEVSDQGWRTSGW